MSRKGNCWDHVPTESGFNSFKEVFDNRTRRHSPLGYKSPMQFAG
jgi:transposase InsO family protein